MTRSIYWQKGSLWTPVTKQTQRRQQILRDFNKFARRMRLMYRGKQQTSSLPCKTYTDNIVSLWTIASENKIQFIEQTNNHHPTIKFTVEISDTEITISDINIYKGKRFDKFSVLDVRTHFKPAETFQYANFSSSHPARVTKGFIKLRP